MDKIKWEVVNIKKPESVNFILGQSHFIKTVEDIHESLVTSVPGIKFGLAFCESSGPRLIRWSGTDKAMIALAKENMKRISAGHSFIIFLAEGYYPVNVLKTIQSVYEVVNIFCATANPAQILVAETGGGRGITGVVDGGVPLGVETEKDIYERKKLLRKIGYKA
jgi:adenosine/AMP kinase